MNTEDRDLVTAAWIARRVGVGRAAVANWRKRHPDFPAPVEDAPGTLFSWNAVRTWLIETGKAEQLASVGRTGTGTQQIGDAAPPIETPDRDLASLSPQELLGRVLVALLPRLGEEDPPEDDSQPPAVLDPACEDPSVLLALAERFGDHVTAVGQAPTTAHARIVREALPEPLLDLRIGDGLATDQFPALHGQARGVVCIPPRESRQWPAHDLAADPRWRYGLPEPGEAELAWVQHCVAYLRHHGVAVVVVSPITGVRSTGRHIRTALVREGVLRDVIALPEKLTPSGEGKVHVWVLQRQAVAKPVRMIDLTWLADIADVPTTRAEWDLLTAAEDPSVTRSVPHRELLDGEVALTPSWYLRPRPAEAVDLGEFTHRLEQLYARVGHALRQPLASPLQSHHAKVTLGELERSRALTILPRDATPRRGDLLFRTMGRPPLVASGNAGDEKGIAQVIGVDQSRLDPHFLAMFVRADASSMPVANTLGALTRDDVRRCRVPRISLREQRRYGDAFRHLQELDDITTRLASASQAVIAQTVHGLTTGALSPPAARLRESITFELDPSDTHSTDETEKSTT